MNVFLWALLVVLAVAIGLHYADIVAERFDVPVAADRAGHGQYAIFGNVATGPDDGRTMTLRQSEGKLLLRQQSQL